MVRVEPDREEGSYVIRLSMEDSRAGKAVDAAAPCRTVEALGDEVARLKEELDRIVEDVREQVQSLGAGEVASKPVNPEEVWLRMETAPSDRDMFDYFNAHSEADRKKVAEYVFTSVNMFKGQGPVFSEHYNMESGFLE
jgi:hypothetical protein